MEITTEILKKNNEALKKAADTTLYLKGGKLVAFESLTDEEKGIAVGEDGKVDESKKLKPVKGHAFCDIVQLTDHKKYGYDHNEVVVKCKLVEAKYALRQNHHHKTTNKVYILSK